MASESGQGFREDFLEDIHLELKLKVGIYIDQEGGHRDGHLLGSGSEGDNETLMKPLPHVGKADRKNCHNIWWAI